MRVRGSRRAGLETPDGHPTASGPAARDGTRPDGEAAAAGLGSCRDAASSPSSSSQPPTWSDAGPPSRSHLRVLAADAVQKVGKRDPGTAMSLAPAAYLLFQRHLRHDPADPQWVGRDRFVLSCGHSSLTLYIQLYLSGYPMSLDDLKSLRTWGSQTPGHPEYHHTPGVEMTTGPLGQGLASAVGMAMAARRERGLLDPDAAPGDSPFDHTVYVIASDGDLQEGVTAEASSIAGHQKLGNLVVLYDQNHISIEDDTDIAFSEDVLARYAAYGWHTQRVDWTEGGTYSEDVEGLDAAIRAATDETGRPSIIALRTIIGWPAPTKQNTGKIHGSALGDEEVAALKTEMGFDPEQTFEVGDDVLAHAREVADRGAALRRDWDASYQAWREGNADGAALLDRMSTRTLPQGWTDALPDFEEGKEVATRKASGEVLTALAPVLPELWGGSADLAESNNTTMEGEPSFVPQEWATKAFPGNPYGRTLHFGIREHAMGSILNGITLHGGTRAYGGTFLIFSDYMRPAVRLAALMELPVDLRVDARLDRSGRGRPHAPADRAPRRAARDPRSRRRPPGRRRRDRLGLADGAGEHEPARRHLPHPAEPAQPRPRRRRRHRRHPRLGRRASRRAVTCWPRPQAAHRTSS